MEGKENVFSVTALVLAILAFLLGLIPIIGWVLLVLATVFTVLAYTRKEKGSPRVIAVVLVSLTWVTKLFILVSLVAFMSSADVTVETGEMNGPNHDTVNID